MTQLRDTAVADQDFDLAQYIRQLEDDLKQRMPGRPITEILVLRELVSRVTVAESQLATMTSIKEPAADEAVEAARFVLEADVDDIDAYHHDFDADGDGDLDAADCAEGQNSEQLKQSAGLKFVESCKITAQALLARTTELQQVTAARDEMVRRNAALRARHDLPFERTDAASKYEAKIRELTTRSLSCCFCNTPAATLRDLKDHSANCRFHPLYQIAQQAKMPVPSVNMGVNELANLVCEHLPQGFHLDLEMELGAGTVRLFDHEGDEIHQGNTDMELAEQITDALNEARSMAGQPPVSIPVSPPQFEPMVADLDQFNNTGWPIHLRRARLKLGTVGLLAAQVAVRQMHDAGAFRTAVTLLDVAGPAVLLTAFQDQLRGPGAKIEIITEDGHVLPMLVGCKADTIGSAAVSNNMVVVSTITFVSPTDITGTDWLRYQSQQ
jgi:hypothetical protein